MTFPQGVRGWIVNTLLRPEFKAVLHESETPLEVMARITDELSELKIRSTQVEASMLAQIQTNIKDQERIDLYHAGLANGLILANSLLRGEPPTFVKTDQGVSA